MKNGLGTSDLHIKNDGNLPKKGITKVIPFYKKYYFMRFLGKNYSPKYLLSRPANAFPCLASSLAIS